MNDRELLEAAARAAGMRVTWEGDNPPYPRATDDGRWNPAWNPLERDGDALRLAVKLHFIIDISEPEYPGIGVFKSHPRIDLEEPKGSDPLAATRRAIVRAAAALAPSDEKGTT